jgi:hypothetical protein
VGGVKVAYLLHEKFAPHPGDIFFSLSDVVKECLDHNRKPIDTGVEVCCECAPGDVHRGWVDWLDLSVKTASAEEAKCDLVEIANSWLAPSDPNSAMLSRDYPSPDAIARYQEWVDVGPSDQVVAKHQETMNRAWLPLDKIVAIEARILEEICR